MNMLNSIIIEGNIKTLPVKQDSYMFCKIECVSDVWDGIKKVEKNIFSLKLPNLKTDYTDYLGELKEGRGIRVVGRLTTGQDNKVFILVDHIEFKPMLTGSNGKN